jgi:hypothetical protein
MEIEGRSSWPSTRGRRGGPPPYAAAVTLTAEPEAERLATNVAPGGEILKHVKDAKPQSATNVTPAFPRWIRPLADFERRESTEVHGPRYG